MGLPEPQLENLPFGAPQYDFMGFSPEKGSFLFFGVEVVMPVMSKGRVMWGEDLTYPGFWWTVSSGQVFQFLGPL